MAAKVMAIRTFDVHLHLTSRASMVTGLGPKIGTRGWGGVAGALAASGFTGRPSSVALEERILSIGVKITHPRYRC